MKQLPGARPRLELFFELVPPEDAVPGLAGASGYGVHDLRSYVKSPVVLRPPMPDRPMRVVDWGRWASASRMDEAVVRGTPPAAAA